MNDKTRKSGRELSDENVEKLLAYLASLRGKSEGLPHRNGKVNITAIALAAGLADRAILYKNPRCKALLDSAVAELGLTGIHQRTDQQSDLEKLTLERRVNQLEARNASLYAENQELRSRLQQYRYIEEMLISQGKRIVA